MILNNRAMFIVLEDQFELDALHKEIIKIFDEACVTPSVGAEDFPLLWGMMVKSRNALEDESK